MSHKFICKYILQMHMKPEVEINLQLRLQMHPANTSGNAFANVCTIGVLQMHLQMHTQIYLQMHVKQGTSAPATNVIKASCKCTCK